MIFWMFVIALVLLGGFAIFAFACDKVYDRKRESYWDLAYNDPIRGSYMENLNKKWYSKVAKLWNDIDCIIKGVIIIIAIIIGIMLIFIGISYGTADGTKATNKQIYASLTYQLENDIYNDNGDDVVGKKALYDQIQEWNEDLAYAKIYEKDFWWGVFWPNIYSDFEFIEYK